VVADREKGVYADPTKVHPIDHRGRYYRVAGPHLSEPSPQRTPILFQAGSSERGREFAARHAECVFVITSRRALGSPKSITADVRRRAARYGRRPEDIRFFQGLSPVVGGTEAEARRKEAEKAYEDTILRAPFAGVVGRKLVVDFANVQAKQPILVLQDTSHLEMVVNVPERDFAVGPRATPALDELTERLQPFIVVSSLPDRKFPARLKELATAADPVTRTFAVTFRFATPEDVNVLPGMTAKVVVRAAGTAGDRTLIPAHAAGGASDGEAFVWLVDPDAMTVTRRPVTLGPLQGDQVEVRSGLVAGDVVAISGVALLRDGMQVRRFER
jgi:multidrug efflux pump subunit AcrA (membrane-fusion protein)